MAAKKHKRKTAVRKPRKRRVSHKKPVRRKRAARVKGISTKSQRHTDYNRNKVNISVGSVIKKHITKARDLLEEQWSKKTLQKKNAKRKSDKKRIGKEITELNRRINKLK